MKPRKKVASHGTERDTEIIRYCRCPKCKYKWKPKVEFPKSCPECKTRLGWYKNVRKGK